MAFAISLFNFRNFSEFSIKVNYSEILFFDWDSIELASSSSIRKFSMNVFQYCEKPYGPLISWQFLGQWLNCMPELRDFHCCTFVGIDNQVLGLAGLRCQKLEVLNCNKFSANRVSSPCFFPSLKIMNAASIEEEVVNLLRLKPQNLRTPFEDLILASASRYQAT